MFNNDPSKYQESSIPRVKTVFTQDRMTAARDIALKHGVTFTLLNKPGEKYTTDEGKSFDLEHDNYYVELSGCYDLTNFWKELDKIAPLKKGALSILVGELIENLKNGTVEEADLVHLQAIVNERIANEKEKDKKYNVG